MKVLLCSINTHISYCLGFLSLTMSLCLVRYGMASFMLFNMYKFVCKTFFLDLLFTCTPLEDFFIVLQDCQNIHSYITCFWHVFRTKLNSFLCNVSFNNISFWITLISDIPSKSSYIIPLDTSIVDNNMISITRWTIKYTMMSKNKGGINISSRHKKQSQSLFEVHPSFEGQ